MTKDVLVWSGDDLIRVPLPREARVLCAPPPLPALPDPVGFLKGALNHPLGMPPLSGLVGSRSRVTIAFDDPCLPIPPMRSDVRGMAVRTIVDELLAAGVEKRNITLLCANGLHRKWTRGELARMLGKALVREFSDGRLSCHDAEDRDALVDLGPTPQGHEVEVNRAVVESDLLIYIAIPWTSMNGGWKSVLVGLGSYRSIRRHHSVAVLDQGTLLHPEASGFHRVLHDMSSRLKGRAKIFKVEAVLTNEVWPPALTSLLTPGEKKLPFMMGVSRHLPQALKDAGRRGMKAAYRPIGFFAGDPEEVHRRALDLLYRQQNVPIKEQTDVLILGAPNLSPYSVFSGMNPLLTANLILGYMFNFHRGKPLVRKGGVLIAFNPCPTGFHPVHHPSYREFFERILPRADKEDPARIESDVADDLATRKEYIEKYRSGFAYHGVHPLFVWAWGIPALRHLGRAVLVGGRDEETVRRIGFHPARSLDEALSIARTQVGRDCSITYHCMPPASVADLT